MKIVVDLIKLQCFNPLSQEVTENRMTHVAHIFYFFLFSYGTYYSTILRQNFILTQYFEGVYKCSNMHIKT